MQYLKANTTATVLVGPAVAIADGVTPVTDVTLAGADHAELMKHDGTTFVDLTADSRTLTHKEGGWYTLTLGTGDTNTEGRLTVLIMDTDKCLPIWKDFMVLAEAAYDSMFVAKDSGYMDVDIKAVGGTATPHTSGKLHVLQGDGNAITAAGPTKTEMDNGHAAIVADTEDLQGNVDTMHDTDLPAVKTVVDALDTLTKAAGDGDLASVKGTVEAITAAGPTNTQLNTAIALITDDLDNGTDGLGALKALIDALNDLSAAEAKDEVMSAFDTAIPGAVAGDSPNQRLNFIYQDTGVTLDALLDTLVDRLTAARAGYLDELAKLADTLEDDAGTYRFTENALEEAPSGSGGDATLAKQNLLIQILTGKWEVTGNQLIMYDTDGVTPLYTFDLTQDGTATEYNPDLRSPV